MQDNKYLIVTFEDDQYKVIDEPTPEQEREILEQVIRNLTHWRVDYEMFLVKPIHETNASLNSEYKLILG